MGAKLANSKQAVKRAHQATKRRIRNRWQKSRMNTSIRRVLEAVSAKDQPLANKAHQLMSALVDKLVSKGVIHKNKAARHKSRLSQKIKAIAS
jgi:small subunit ribosomal protein S20